MKKNLLMLSVFALIFGLSTAQAAVYEIDNSHSNLGFAVKHLEAGKTRGAFNDYTGMITFDPADYSTFSANVTIQAASIDTNNEARDNHLKSGDFFEVETYPTLTFTSTRLEKRGEAAAIIGDLTIKGVTKQVTIPVTVSGPIQSPFGTTVVGIEGFTVINRQDFNVKWNKALDNGNGFVVGNEVDLAINIEAIMKQ